MLAFLLDHFKENLRIIPDYSTFESTFVEISDPSFSAYFICLCRPPGLPTNFFEEFQDLHIKDPPLPARSSRSVDFKMFFYFI